MALLVLLLIVGALFVLQRFGSFRDHPITWDLTWRIFLNVLIAIALLTMAVKLWGVGEAIFHLDTRVLVAPAREPPVDIASAMVLAFGLIGVWRRRKWSAWVVIGRLVVTIGLQVFIYRALGWDMVRGLDGWRNVTGDVADLLMWAWAFNRNWKHFGHSDYGKYAKQRNADLRSEEGEELPSA